jgi:hypothetical protein
MFETFLIEAIAKFTGLTIVFTVTLEPTYFNYKEPRNPTCHVSPPRTDEEY